VARPKKSRLVRLVLRMKRTVLGVLPRAARVRAANDE
jgi:hypothetical protein